MCQSTGGVRELGRSSQSISAAMMPESSPLQRVSVSGSGKPLNVSTAYLLNIFFGPASTIPWRAVGRRSDRRRQRFNSSRHRRLNLECRAQPAQSLLAAVSGGRMISEFRYDPDSLPFWAQRGSSILCNKYSNSTLVSIMRIIIA
jgi:hypothetical protein